MTKYRLRNKAAFKEKERSFILDKSPFPGLRLSRAVFGMDRSLPPGERYHIGHPLARRILADCLEGRFTSGSMTLKAGGAVPAELSGEIDLWRIGMTSEAGQFSEPVLCGMTDAGEPLSEAECVELFKLEPLAYEGGPEESADEDESYRGRIWKTRARSETRPAAGNARLEVGATPLSQQSGSV